MALARSCSPNDYPVSLSDFVPTQGDTLKLGPSFLATVMVREYDEGNGPKISSITLEQVADGRSRDLDGHLAKH